MRIAVLGSINLDLVASGAPLPRAGETVSGAVLGRHPGGKGANQALAAARLGAEVQLVGRTGQDGMADEALALLRQAGADLSGVVADPSRATGVALIAVSPEGENQITVCSGANAAVEASTSIRADALICQLECPVEAVAATASSFAGFVSVNLAPAVPVPDDLLARADLMVVNESEAAFYGDALLQSPAMVAITLGAAGAELWQGGRKIAEARPPKVEVVDSTGAGDVFVAALTVALIEGQPAGKALAFACAAGALATTCAGAQPSAPQRTAVEAVLEENP